MKLEKMVQTIDSSELISLVRGYLKFPYPTICRHAVALDLLDVLERSGVKLPDGLTASVSNSEDHLALGLL